MGVTGRSACNGNGAPDSQGGPVRVIISGVPLNENHQLLMP